MFTELLPLLAERQINIAMTANKDGLLTILVAPGKANKDEPDAFITPFSVQATAEELDTKFPEILREWVEVRRQTMSSLSDALEQAKAELAKAAEEAKKKAEEAKKKGGKYVAPASKTPAVKPVMAEEKAEETPPPPATLDLFAE